MTNITEIILLIGIGYVAGQVIMGCVIIIVIKTHDAIQDFLDKRNPADLKPCKC